MHAFAVRLSPTRFVRHKFLWLLLLFLIYPSALVLTKGAVLYLGLDAAAVGILTALLFVARPYRPVAVLVALLAAAALMPVVLATRLGRFAGSVPLLTTRTVLLLAVFGAVTTVALVSLFKRERVTLDKVLGAVCVYLFIGATWGLFYELLVLLRPDAFQGSAPAVLGSVGPGATVPSLSLGDALYFSYATLTTIGSSNLMPATVQAKTLVWVEAIAGQIYIAVLIARLVSLQILHSTTNGRRQRTARSGRRAPVEQRSQALVTTRRLGSPSIRRSSRKRSQGR